MAAAAEAACDPRDVHSAVGRAQAHLAPALVGDEVAYQARHERALHLAHVVDDPLRVALVGVGVREVVPRQVGERQRAAVEALDRGERARQELDPAEWQPFVEALVDLGRMYAGGDQIGRHLVRGRGRVLEHELPGGGHEPDVEGLGERLAQLDAELAPQLVHDLRRARRLWHDQVHVAEPRVVVVVVDVDDPDTVGFQELDRHPVHVPAVEEDDQPLLEVVRRLTQDVVEAHVPVLVRERELGGTHVHDGVLAEGLEHELHRAQRPERVAVRVLVRRQEELRRGPKLLEHLLLLRRGRHSGDRLRSSWDRSSVIRMPSRIESSCTKSSVGVRFIRSSSPTRCWRKPRAELSPSRAASRSWSPPRTLTNTRALRRSALVSTPVTVTKPMRGSATSSARWADTTSRTASLTRRILSPAILVVTPGTGRASCFGRDHYSSTSSAYTTPRSCRKPCGNC